MEIFEAIEHAIDVYNSKNKQLVELNELQDSKFGDLEIYQCKQCADEHKQLAEWLIELEAFKLICERSAYYEDNTMMAMSVEKYNRGVIKLRKRYGLEDDL